MNDEEEIDTSALSMDDKVALLMEELPGPVQRFVQSPERDAVSLRLSQKYRLHADAAGAFDHAYLFMLLGIYSPEEFAQELKDAGLDQATISGLAADVNEQVFKRLRAEEQGGTERGPAKRVPPPPAVPVMSIGAAPPAATPLPVPPAPPPQASAELYASAQFPQVRTMASDMETLAHGMQGNPVSPARSFQTASVPITQVQSAPQNPAPPTAPLPPAPVSQPEPQPQYQPPRYVTPPPLGADGDPYREPVE